MTAPFKYTITVEKAETTDEGMFIEGVASGMGVDSQGHEMDPEAIERFAQQIAERVQRGDPIPYLDWHNDKSVLSELGHVVQAAVDPNWSLRIRVKLDETNPASQHLYSAIKNKGKKFGMSVKGVADPAKVKRYVNAAGQSVMRFFDVALTEVSNTTKPIWTPSFGTVLAKAVIDEADAESVEDGGDNPEMSKDDTAELQPGVTESAPADEDTTTEEPEADAAEDEATEDTTTEESTEAAEEEVEVEKAGAKYSKKAKDNFLAMYKQMGDMLRAEGILDEEDEPVKVEKADDADKTEDEDKTTAQTDDESDSAAATDKPAEADASADSDDADKGADAEPAKSDRELELERQLAEMTARAEAAESKSKSPQMVVTPENTQPDPAAVVREELAKLPRGERLRSAFQLAEAARGTQRR